MLCAYITEIKQGKDYEYCEKDAIEVFKGVPYCEDHHPLSK